SRQAPRIHKVEKSLPPNPLIIKPDQVAQKRILEMQQNAREPLPVKVEKTTKKTTDTATSFLRPPPIKPPRSVKVSSEDITRRSSPTPQSKSSYSPPSIPSSGKYSDSEESGKESPTLSTRSPMSVSKSRSSVVDSNDLEEINKIK